MSTIAQSVSRRRFCSRCAAATLLPAAGSLARASESKPAPAHDYLDIHVHLGQPWNERGPLTPEMLLRWMDAHDISAAVVLSLVSPESWFYPITSQWVLEQTIPHRDRLIPFCAIDPRSVNLGGRAGYRDLLERYRDAGARGFGEHKWGGPIDDPRNVELLGTCGELELPVLFHLDRIRNTDRPGLPGLESVLRQLPNTTLIGHGPGWWASISADVRGQDLSGYPRGNVAPGGALDRLLDRYPRLYADLSAGSGANAIRRDLSFGRDFLERHAERILFGTDYLADGQEIPQFELLDQLELTAATRAKINRENARRLLK